MLDDVIEMILIRYLVHFILDNMLFVCIKFIKLQWLTFIVNMEKQTQQTRDEAQSNIFFFFYFRSFNTFILVHKFINLNLLLSICVNKYILLVIDLFLNILKVIRKISSIQND